MRAQAMIGVLLIVFGIIALGFQGVTYFTTDRVVDVGPLQIDVALLFSTISASPQVSATAAATTPDMPYEAVPNFFQAPPGDLPTPQQATVTLLRQKGAFHLKGATLDDPKLQAKVETVRDGQEYRITVSYAGGWEAGVVQKQLTITTDDPKQPEMKIPVHAMVQPAGLVH